LDGFREEILDYYKEMRRFNDMDGTEVFQSLSAFSARASEIREYLTHFDTKRNQSFRIKAVDPFLDECDRQFKIHSRIQAVRDMEVRLAGGNFT